MNKVISLYISLCVHIYLVYASIKNYQNDEKTDSKVDALIAMIILSTIFTLLLVASSIIIFPCSLVFSNSDFIAIYMIAGTALLSIGAGFIAYSAFYRSARFRMRIEGGELVKKTINQTKFYTRVVFGFILVVIWSILIGSFIRLKCGLAIFG
jgi:hypothetical protein